MPVYLKWKMAYLSLLYAFLKLMCLLFLLKFFDFFHRGMSWNLNLYQETNLLMEIQVASMIHLNHKDCQRYEAIYLLSIHSLF